MSASPESQHSFDEAELLERLEGDHELLVDLAETFIDTHDIQLKSMKSALSAGDFVALGQVAHAMKGSLATLGATAKKHAAAIENYAKPMDRDQCEREVLAIEEAMQRLVADLAHAIQRLKV